MKRFNVGVGTKIFGGFICVIVIGAIIGAAGYFSLNRVIAAGELNGTARETQGRVLEARAFEKDYILKKNEESYQKLTKTLDELAVLTNGLKAKMERTKEADEIAQAVQVAEEAEIVLLVLGDNEQTCREGWWRYSRHPNYFFEWLHWWSYVALAVGASYWWLTLLSPAVMLYFLVCVTGIPPTEAQALASRGEDYRQYQRTTSVFIPWFPKERGENGERK